MGGTIGHCVVWHNQSQKAMFALCVKTEKNESHRCTVWPGKDEEVRTGWQSSTRVKLDRMDNFYILSNHGITVTDSNSLNIAEEAAHNGFITISLLTHPFLEEQGGTWDSGSKGNLQISENRTVLASQGRELQGCSCCEPSPCWDGPVDHAAAFESSLFWKETQHIHSSAIRLR